MWCFTARVIHDSPKTTYCAMKKSLQTAFAVFAFVLSNLSASYAQLSETYVAGIGSETIREAAFTLIITPVGGTVLDVSLAKKPYAHVQVQIRDAQKTTLFTQHSRAENSLFAQRIDLHKLEPGTYWLNVWVDKKHIVRRLELAAINGEYVAVMLP